MLSPDPFLQAPGNSQSYNRYSYAFNNPLKYTDPSGYINIQAIINQLSYSANGGHWSAGDASPTFFSSASDASNYVNDNFSHLTSGGSGDTQRNIVQIFDSQGNSYYYDKNSGEIWNPETLSFTHGADLFPGQMFYDSEGNYAAVFLPGDVEITGEPDGGGLTNNSNSTIYYKPENSWEALSLEPGKSISGKIDGVNINGTVFKVVDGYDYITVNSDSKILFDYPALNPNWPRVYQVDNQWLKTTMFNEDGSKKYYQKPNGEWVEDKQWWYLFNSQ